MRVVLADERRGCARSFNMTEAIADSAGGVAATRPATINIPVKTGEDEERMIGATPGSRVTVTLEVLAAERGCRMEELILIRDGDDEPLTEAVLIEEDYPCRRRHHVHRTGEVAVTVFYQAARHERAFKRHTTVEEVLLWAITAFNVDASMASEFELTRHGQRNELPGSEHIGHLAGHERTLCLELARGHISNGCRS
jgi:hypothetical protein